MEGYLCVCKVKGRTGMMDKRMKNKKALLFVAVLLPVAIIGGLFTGIYTFAGYAEPMKQQLYNQLGGYGQYLTIVVVQSTLYAVICSFFGYILADKTGLLKPFALEKRKLTIAAVLAVICGVAFGLDYWIFGRHISEAAEACRNVTLNSVIASVLYGGVVEEVMLRLFVMSLLSFVLWKIFYRTVPKEKIPVKIFAVANVIAALLFAAGHLPATFLTFQTVDALVIIRCFLYNGGLGLVFGWLYRKYGIQYAMIGHAGTHIISKLIWLLFLS